MSDAAGSAGAPEGDATKPAAARPAGRHFRPARVAMERGAAERQGRIAQAAFLALGDRDAALAFLNTHDDALGQRPIDAAVSGADGLAAAERLLGDRTQAQDDAPVSRTPPVT